MTPFEREGGGLAARDRAVEHLSVRGPARIVHGDAVRGRGVDLAGARLEHAVGQAGGGLLGGRGRRLHVFGRRPAASRCRAARRRRSDRRSARRPFAVDRRRRACPGSRAGVFSPTTISFSASVQPGMTSFTPKVVGVPRATELSNIFRLWSSPSSARRLGRRPSGDLCRCPL